MDQRLCPNVHTCAPTNLQVERKDDDVHIHFDCSKNRLPFSILPIVKLESFYRYLGTYLPH